LNEGKIFLRDIIDLEATYAGPESKGGINPNLIANGGAEVALLKAQPTAPSRARPPMSRRRPRAVGDPVPRGARWRRPGAEEKDPAEAAARSDMDDDEFENQMSLAAIEAELEAEVVETFDKIASEYKKLRRLQEQDIANQLQSESLSPSQGAQVQEAEGRDHRRGESRCA